MGALDKLTLLPVLDLSGIMSYINKALRRLQKEKNSPYEAYRHLFDFSEKKPQRYSKWLSLFGVMTVFCFAAAMIVFLNTLDETKARAVFQSVPFKPPVAAIYAQALEMQRKGNLQEAKTSYEKIVKIDPQNVQALNNLGVIYMEQKDYEMAIKYFHDALDMNNDYVDAHYNLACVYAQKKDSVQSMMYLKKAVAFNPQARQWAKNDDDLKPLRGLPEFSALMKEPGNLP